MVGCGTQHILSKGLQQLDHLAGRNSPLLVANLRKNRLQLVGRQCVRRTNVEQHTLQPSDLNQTFSRDSGTDHILFETRWNFLRVAEVWQTKVVRNKVRVRKQPWGA